jgi:hypothetical protein
MAATRQVGGSGAADTGDCTSTPCATIGYAVGQAQPNDTIQIAAGTYDETVTTSKDLTFAGAGPGSTIIDSTNLSGSALAVSGNDTIRDLTVHTNDAGIGGALSISNSGGTDNTVLVHDVDAETAPTGNGSDAIAIGSSQSSPAPEVTITDSAATATNSDAAISNSGPNSQVVQDGSGIEMTAGTLNLLRSKISVVRGIGLRIHGNAQSVTVRDSVIIASGTEDLADPHDHWQAVEAAIAPVSFTFSTIVNETQPANPDDTTPDSHRIYPTDALLAIQAPVTLDSTIVRAQPATNSNFGSDIEADATGGATSVTASDSAFTTAFTEGGATATTTATGGNIPGDPGFVGSGDDPLSLAAGSGLAGAGDVAALNNGETDVLGNTRGASCTGTPSEITNVGAYEIAAPTCPQPPASGDSIGALTQLSGAGNCITGQLNGTGCNTSGVPGMTGGSPEDLALSADGKNVYTVTEDPTDNGIDVAEFSRTANGLSQLAAPNNCISSSTQLATACGTNGDAALKFAGSPTPFPLPARIAISPDGKSVYVDNGTVISGFSRNATTGALTPFPDADCIEGFGSDSSCATNDLDQMGPAATLVVSPDNKTVYLATLDGCSFATFAGRQPHVDPQNHDCGNDQVQFFAQGDVAVFSRDPSTGLLTPGPCYSNGHTPTSGCQQSADGLYGITSLAVSPDDKNVYVTSDRNAQQGMLSADPGEVTEFSRDQSTGALTELTGAGACLTAGGGCGVDAGTNGVAGLIEPQQIVISPDGKSAYVASAQYTNGGVGSPVDAGLEVASTLTQYSRDTSTGVLSPLAGATCFAGYQQACTGNDGVAADVVQIPGMTGAEGLVISPDGQSVYVSTENDNVDSAVAQFSRVTTTGLLTPLSAPNTCLANGTPPGAGDGFACGHTDVAGLSDSTPALPGNIAITGDCTTVYVLSVAVVELGRSVPGDATGCNASSTGPSAASLSTTGLNFDTSTNGPVKVGTTATQKVTITDIGNGSLPFTSATISGAQASQFTIVSDTCSGQTIAAGGSCAITVKFTPVSESAAAGALTIVDGASDSPQTVTLSGIGGVVHETSSPTLLGFVDVQPYVPQTPQYVTITASGNLPLHISSASVIGADAAQFKIKSETCTSQPVAAGSSCTVNVEWTNPGTAVANATLVIADDAVDGGGTQTVALQGTPPVGLSGGVTFDSDRGLQSSGVPTVYWGSPWTLDVPASIPATGPPNTEQLVNQIIGVGSNVATRVGQGRYTAEDLLLGVYYGPDGTAEGVTDPIIGQIACSGGLSGPCAGIAAESGVDNGATPPSAPGASIARFGHIGAQPAASSSQFSTDVAGDCPPAKPVGWDIEPTDEGGIKIVYNYPDGTQDAFLLQQVAIPPMPATGNLIHDFFFATVIGGANQAINDLLPEVGVYNTIIGTLNSLATLHQGNGLALHALEDGNLALSMAGNFDQELHGPWAWFANRLIAALPNLANSVTHSKSALQLSATPDCPHQHGDGYSDPSGLVKTNTGIPVANAKVVLSRSSSRHGKAKPVKNGSIVMSPANRKNPDHTTLVGHFGWDTLPGFYQVAATHPGCSAAKSRGRTALTSLFSVPPPRSNLSLALRCPHLRRAATKLKLAVLKGEAGSVELLATVRPARGNASKHALQRFQGTVSFTIGHYKAGAVPVRLSNGVATLAVPATSKAAKSYTAVFSGNGLVAPSRARAR